MGLFSLRNGRLVRRRDVTNLLDSRTRELCSSTWKCFAWWTSCWCGPTTLALLQTKYQTPTGNSNTAPDIGPLRAATADGGTESAARPVNDVRRDVILVCTAFVGVVVAAAVVILGTVFVFRKMRRQQASCVVDAGEVVIQNV